MTQIPVKLGGFVRGWTSQATTGPGEIGRWSRWLDNRGKDGVWPARGYKRYRLVSPVLSKPAYSWIHRDTDKTEHPMYFVDTKLLAETGSDSPAAVTPSISISLEPIIKSM